MFRYLAVNEFFPFFFLFFKLKKEWLGGGEVPLLGFTKSIYYSGQTWVKMSPVIFESDEYLCPLTVNQLL